MNSIDIRGRLQEIVNVLEVPESIIEKLNEINPITATTKEGLKPLSVFTTNPAPDGEYHNMHYISAIVTMCMQDATPKNTHLILELRTLVEQYYTSIETIIGKDESKYFIDNKVIQKLPTDYIVCIAIIVLNIVGTKSRR